MVAVKTQVVLAAVVVAVQALQAQMVARTLVAMVEQAKRTTSLGSMSHTPAVAAVAVIATRLELAELVAVEMEAVGETKPQRKVLTA